MDGTVDDSSGVAQRVSECAGVFAGMIATTLGAESQFFRRWDLRAPLHLPKSASSDARNPQAALARRSGSCWCA